MKIRKQESQRGTGLIDFIFAASIFGIATSIAVGFQVVAYKQARFTKVTQDQSLIAERLAGMLAERRLRGAENGIVYVSPEGVTFKPAAGEAVAYAYSAVGAPADDKTMTVYVTTYPVLKEMGRRTVKAAASYPSPATGK